MLVRLCVYTLKIWLPLSKKYMFGGGLMLRQYEWTLLAAGRLS